MNPPSQRNSSQRKEQEAIQAIIERASRDAEFRRALLLDPRRAIEEAYAATIPPTFRIRFIEKDAISMRSSRFLTSRRRMVGAAS